MQMIIYNILLLLSIFQNIYSVRVLEEGDRLDNYKNISEVSMGLAQIIKAIKPLQLAILIKSPDFNLNIMTNGNDFKNVNYELEAEMEMFHFEKKHLNNFLQQLHKFYINSVIYDNVTLFFQYTETNLLSSIESVNLIFYDPQELIERIYEQKLAHRLSLFIFYWGANRLPRHSTLKFPEPLRVIVITRPRKNASFRIYYNQADSSGNGYLKLVSWYDGDNLGLSTDPLLPSASTVYSNFHGRVFRVPVFHSPPWFWVNYQNESQDNVTTNHQGDNNDAYENDTQGENDENINEMNEMDNIKEVHVVGGRDHRLLQLLAKYLNFQFMYVEAPGRTQGTLHSDNESNETFTGGIGLLQNGLADFFLGDVSLSWERRKAIEFTFFTLADSGAFATHAPRHLNEALALMRPFKLNVWPYLIITVLLSGPIFYIIIIIPYKWQGQQIATTITTLRNNEQHTQLPKYKQNERCTNKEKLDQFYLTYIKEITLIDRVNSRVNLLPKFLKQTSFAITITEDNMTNHSNHNNSNSNDDDCNLKMPNNLFDKCLWFTVQLFLKQSFKEFYHGYRAKFLTIVYCIAGTYVLADVYSAQLTSQFARPAHEPPINTLQQLQHAMIQDGYQLFVEKESSSLEMLENGTEIFRQLYSLMKLQNPHEDDGYLIDSMEAGIQLIADGHENKVVLGGRETLYFNLKQHGLKRFQLSHKLYTRYSAVAVQIGCPYLDSLNNILIRLFEGGILDKMTIAEYEIQSRMINNNKMEVKPHDKTTDANTNQSDHNALLNNNNNNNNKGNYNNQNNIQETLLANSMKKVSNTTATTSTESNSEEATSATSGPASMPISTAVAKTTASITTTPIIQPLNLRMLQGAFLILIVGYTLAGFTWLLELWFHKRNHKRNEGGDGDDMKHVIVTNMKYLQRKFWLIIKSLIMRFFIHFE